MKKLFLILLVLMMAIFAGCKSKSKNSNNNTNNVPTNVFIPGEDFNFYGYNGSKFVELGGSINVKPVELFKVGIRFRNTFLNVIADLTYEWPERITLEMRDTSGGDAVAIAEVDTYGTVPLPPSMVNRMLSYGEGNYYFAACAGGFGTDRCSGVNKIHYQGEENSAYFPSPPTNLTGNSGCTSITFNMGYYDISNIYNIYKNYPVSYFPQIEIYRSMQVFSDPSAAYTKIPKDISYVNNNCYPNSICTITVSNTGYTSSEYIGVRVRDIDGKLSPLSNVIECY